MRSSGCEGIAMKKTRPLFITICSHWQNGQTVSKQDGPASMNGHEKIKVLTGEVASWAEFHQGNKISPSVEMTVEVRRECGAGVGQGEVERSDLTQRNKGEDLAPDKPACLGDSEAH